MALRSQKWQHASAGATSCPIVAWRGSGAYFTSFSLAEPAEPELTAWEGEGEGGGLTASHELDDAEHDPRGGH
jgi:hypothetical protein